MAPRKKMCWVSRSVKGLAVRVAGEKNVLTFTFYIVALIPDSNLT